MKKAATITDGVAAGSQPEDEEPAGNGSLTYEGVLARMVSSPADGHAVNPNMTIARAEGYPRRGPVPEQNATPARDVDLSSTWTTGRAPSASPPPTYDEAAEDADDVHTVAPSSASPGCLSVFRRPKGGSTINTSSRFRSVPWSSTTTWLSREDFVPPVPFPEAYNRIARIRVHNSSASLQAFIVYPAPPQVQSDRPGLADLRYGVYQACRSLSPGTGTFTFQLPCGPPLNWGVTASPTLVAVTGCTYSSDGASDLVLDPTDYTPVSAGPQGKNFCVMTMPPGGEARFYKDGDVPSESNTGPKLADGFIAIKTVGAFSTTSDKKPFVGIGAIDPRSRTYIVPVITWAASPNQVYVVKPDMAKWMVAPMQEAEPGLVIDPSQRATAERVSFDPNADKPVDVYCRPDNTIVIFS
ncbi:hypothetical protein LX36DRAFT_659224 [Colletotrichum falcatum]|nr:hypothetical protein LX36DRAFT_659224 [Colletotrichum falcatum]